MTNPLTPEAFLAALGLQTLQDVFEENAIDAALLFTLDKDDLDDLNISDEKIATLLWGVAHIQALRAWLEEVGLPEYLGTLAQSQVELAKIATLSKEDLKNMGILKIGHRKRLLAHAPRIDEDEAAAADAESPVERKPSAEPPLEKEADEPKPEKEADEPKPEKEPAEPTPEK